MENAKKTFISGLNSDDSIFALKQDDHINAENIRVVTSSNGKAGSVSNVDGTTSIVNGYNLQDAICIGSYEDQKTNDIYFFVIEEKSSANPISSIYVYKSDLNQICKVLSDANLSQDYLFGFQQDKPVTGVAVIDGLLYFTGINGKEPFRINVDRGIKLNDSNYVTTETAYITPIPKNVVTLIRRPPMIPLVITAQEDASRDTSFLRSRGHTFAYRYVYKDGETSVFSPTSHHYPHQDADDANHKTTKKIKVDFPKNEAESYGISQDVSKIEFGVKFDNDTSFFIWKEFDSVKNATEFANQTTNVEGVITGDYYNDVLGFSVDDSNSSKLTDTVPIEAEALTIARNRLFLANLKQGRLNKRKINPSDISLQITTSALDSSFTQYDRNRGGKVGFSHASAYQIGIVFFDFAGRSGGVLTDDSLKIITPERDHVLSTYNSSIDFTINSSADSLIPDWAEFYAIVRTKNLTKDFTISNLSDKVRYFRTASTGGFTVNVEQNFPDNSTTQNQGIAGTPNGTFSEEEFESFNADHEGVAIGLGDLTSYKQGYSYQEGDRVKLITPNNVFEANIIGQEGRYVKTNLIDINSSEFLNTSGLSEKDFTVVYEIFSPHKIQPNEFYYESFIGRITGASGSRTYSNKTGSLIGDVYVKSLEADTSTFQNFFFSTKGSSESENNDQTSGNVSYIDFPVYYGTGQNDASFNTGTGNYTGSTDLRYEVKVSSTGTPDKFQWRARSTNQIGIETSYSSEINITGSAQTLSNGVTVTFGATTGHSVGDRWAVGAKGTNSVGNSDNHGVNIYKDLPGSIIEGSEVEIKYRERKRGTAINSAYNFEWTRTKPASEITQTFANLEELCWETNFGTTLAQAHSNSPNNIIFRRGTIGTTGGGGTKIFMLDSENGSGGTVSQSDGSGIHMIIRSVATQNSNAGRNVHLTGHWKVDFAEQFAYKTEQMSPSNDYFLQWMQITGRPNLVVKDVDTQINKTGISFSETKASGSKLNGLSKFSALDQTSLDENIGPIRKLAITTKTQSTGTFLLALSENETTAVYLGEQQLQQTSSGNQFLAVSSGVIGTTNSLKGSYGTLHPESFVVNEGAAYWYDQKNFTVVKYTGEGLLPIGDIKMKTFFKEKSNIIASDTQRRFVTGTYDSYNNEYILTLPKTGETTVVLQDDAFFPTAPILVFENPSTSPTSNSVQVRIQIQGQLEVTQTVDFVDGTGTATFNSPVDFSIPSGVVISPTGTSIAVANSTFSASSVSGSFAAGSGSLTISGVTNETLIVLQLSETTIPSGGPLLVENVKTYSGDTNLVFGPLPYGNTPIRVTGATVSATSSNIEEKSISASSGNLSIAATSSSYWTYGTTNSLTTDGVFYRSAEGDTQIPTSEIDADATGIIESGTLIGYFPGSFTITVSGVLSDHTGVLLNSRPLKEPLIQTEAPTNITTTGYTANAEITSNNATVTEKGFVCGTATIPAIGDGSSSVKVVSGTSDGAYSEDVTGLTASTTYYFRPYIKNNMGPIANLISGSNPASYIRYGAVESVTTGSVSNSVPSVTTNSFSNNVFSGTITSNGGATTGTNGITERGFLHSELAQVPTEGGVGVTKVTAQQFQISAFPYSYSSLVSPFNGPMTLYYRAYAKNDVGIGYGSVLSVNIPSASAGIGGFNVPAQSQVSEFGGMRQFTATKSTTTGAAAGTVDVDLNDGTSVVGSSQTVNVSFQNNQTSETVQIQVPQNFTEQARTLTVKITSFSGIANHTGQSVPITIGYLTQAGGTN